MYFERELNRLKSIDWDQLGRSWRESDFDLATDFLFRAASLLRSHDMSFANPFFGPSQVFSKRYVLSGEIWATFADFQNLANYPLVEQAAFRHLEFCLAADGMLGSGPDELANLYEPLIKLFSEGGIIDRHHGELIVADHWVIPFQNWMDRALKRNRDVDSSAN